MADLDTPSAVRWRLARFGRDHASLVASWVKSDEELFRLAPSCSPPVSASKVAGWTSRGGEAYLLSRVGDAEFRGYGEINRFSQRRDCCWLGHLLIDPAHRGCGAGKALTELLVRVAARRFGAKTLVLVVFPENEAAIRCYERCGFVYCKDEFHRFAGRGHCQRLLRFELQTGSRRFGGLIG